MKVALKGQIRFPWLKFTTKAGEEYEFWISLYQFKFNWWKRLANEDQESYCKCLAIQFGVFGFTHLAGECKEFTFEADDHP